MKLPVAFIILLLATFTTKAQLSSPVKVFEHGSLILKSGGTIRAGDHLLAGTGAGENHWYKSLGFANNVNLLYMLGRNNELKYDYDNSSDDEYRRTVIRLHLLYMPEIYYW